MFRVISCTSVFLAGRIMDETNDAENAKWCVHVIYNINVLKMFHLPFGTHWVNYFNCRLYRARALFLFLWVPSLYTNIYENWSWMDFWWHYRNSFFLGDCARENIFPKCITRIYAVYSETSKMMSGWGEIERHWIAIVVLPPSISRRVYTRCLYRIFTLI